MTSYQQNSEGAEGSSSTGDLRRPRNVRRHTWVVGRKEHEDKYWVFQVAGSMRCRGVSPRTLPGRGHVELERPLARTSRPLCAK